jgi:hypothetical protein
MKTSDGGNEWTKSGIRFSWNPKKPPFQRKMDSKPMETLNFIPFNQDY